MSTLVEQAYNISTKTADALLKTAPAKLVDMFLNISDSVERALTIYALKGGVSDGIATVDAGVKDKLIRLAEVYKDYTGNAIFTLPNGIDILPDGTKTNLVNIFHLWKKNANKSVPALIQEQYKKYNH